MFCFVVDCVIELFPSNGVRHGTVLGVGITGVRILNTFTLNRYILDLVVRLIWTCIDDKADSLIRSASTMMLKCYKGFNSHGD